ncbi:peroxisome proliferator-activated receptor gamma coactivator-related protein 1-like isoform X1 [Channa argus]|uniref:peroxisome proliferator-activated receptor gamma coactivator-related protein 1-like isoform X1 n=1 Tax=Channa argus TaxID=215402 RepID=UPI002946F684|nr:hypothetical protein Q8A73_003678 [Channa argus]
MWSSKMAARWRRKDGHLNAGNSDFLASNNPNELILSRGDVADGERDTESCMDHSILAILEDSATGLENKSGAEEESETLLSALTEMLDSVEDDDTLSPFDTLPDTRLLLHPDRRDSSATMKLAERLRPRSKSSCATFKVKSVGENGDETKMERKSLPLLFKQQSHPENTKAENEFEVFTSASLVNLVKLMHPYCLKLHVDEGDNVRKKHLFSQGEVWKYERPTEEGDEEINVVSDDEAHVKKRKDGDQVEEDRHNVKVLKSVLLKGISSRGKKRVSFGPVQVASFDESVGKGLIEKNLTSGQTSETMSLPLNDVGEVENPSGSAPEPQTPFSEMNSVKAEDLGPKGETKPKSLSLQQYRQLRQKRQPLVEKQGNYTTKWPSVSEPPKELPPILCLQGPNSCRPKTTRNPDCTRIGTGHLHKPGHQTSSHRTLPPSTHLHHSRLKRPRTAPRNISPASPLAEIPANRNIFVAGNKKSPLKMPTLCSSDPPNPVLLPLPVSRTASPSTDQSSSTTEVDRDSNLQSLRHLEEIQNHSLAVSPQSQPSSSEPKPQVLLLNQNCTTLLQETNKFIGIASDISPRSPTQCQTESASKLQDQTGCLSTSKETDLKPKTPQSLHPDPLRPIKCPCSMLFSVQPPSSVDDPIPLRETVPEVPPSIYSHEEPPPTHQPVIGGQSETGESGIEATDLTSLLEQFEETQAKEERGCENELKPKVVSAAPPLNMQTPEDLHLHIPHYTGSESTSSLALEPLSTLKNPRNLTDFQMLECVDIPEPLSTEVILSIHQEQPAQRKTPPCKAIQIIDPRPLPSKKTSHSDSLAPAHNFSYTHSSVTSDHDYCGPVDRSLTGATHRRRAKSSLLKDVSKTTGDSQLRSYDSDSAAKCKTQTSRGPAMSQYQSNQPRFRLETEMSPDRALQFSNSATAGNCGVGQEKTAPFPLPTPPPSPPCRGREKRRYRGRSPRSDSSSCSSSSSSSSSSASRAPKRQKFLCRRSESSSCSSSRSRSISRSPPRRNRLSYLRLGCSSRSRSRSWSPSRSRSPSPRIHRRRWRDVCCSSRESRRLRREHEIRIQKLKAIDERRVVYVGRICRSMTHDELRGRFCQFGDVECVSLHFRDGGDHYAFVTFYNMEDAFAAIDNGGKLRKPNELPFDICFGGRRQFCNSDYSDLDANRDTEPSPAKSTYKDLDFDSLLKQAQKGLKR